MDSDIIRECVEPFPPCIQITTGGINAFYCSDRQLPIIAFPISSICVNSQEVLLIYTGILLKVGKENAKNLHKFPFSSSWHPL
jgi:hypothetical protein